MSKISTYFRTEEFVPKEIFSRYGESSVWFIDKRIVLLADFIRDRFGVPMKINDWYQGGSLNNRGFRVPDCATGGTLSQHKFKAAIDFSFESVTPQDIYKDINDNFDMYSKAGLTTIEDIAMTPSWTHVDIRQTNSDKLLIVQPSKK